ncbi:hypothetical protein BBJ28_00005215 [Nothophytophthora sp. Chile5]|nr:hypothetical protein BBJ28_00005215 [Nothophytophthora sp. Chile5]
MFLLETPYVGFDAFLTAGVLVVFAFVAIVILNKTPSAFSGLIARDNKAREMASFLACGFHVVIFVVQSVVTTVVVKSKEDVIDTYAGG